MFIKVFATPGAKKEKVEQSDDTFRISVREPANGNRANDRIRAILAELHHVPIGKVRILTGHRSRAKMVSINR